MRAQFAREVVFQLERIGLLSLRDIANPGSINEIWSRAVVVLRAGVGRERRWAGCRSKLTRGLSESWTAGRWIERSLGKKTDGCQVPEPRDLKAVIRKGIHDAKLRRDCPGSGPVRISHHA